MKKMIMVAVAALFAFSAYAQNPAAIKQLKGLKDYQEALGIVNSNLQTMTNQEKAQAYNFLVDIALNKFDKENNIQLTNQVTKQETPYDKVGMCEAARNAVLAAIECDKYDQMPNEKGKVKPKFRAKNAGRLTSARNALINAGQDAFNEKNYQGAEDCFGTFVTSKQMPLFEGLPKEDYYNQIAYYASLAAYNNKNYPAASKYADLCLNDTALANDAMDVKILSMKSLLKTKEDSVNYANEIKTIYDKDPSNERMFSLLVEYYQASGNKDVKKALIEKQVSTYPSKMSWALKGESEMGDQKWADAIVSYKKSLELDPDFIQVRFNLALCQNNQAITLKDANGGVLAAESKTLLQSSIENLEKVKEKDPNREQVNWVYTMYQAYYLLGNTAKAKELESLLQK
ncbi:MAG: hypothetical protein PUH24_04495 [Prevotellaceae bacterium]|nr:hypothetical protein [Prevotellaceae bacterium]MDY6130129.1 hypothetical protein [Prevotella sp.]